MESSKGQITTEKKLKPNQPGTKKWVEKYGNDLVCVRYRYDEENKIRYKTVEIIVEKKSYERKKPVIPSNKIVSISLDYYEFALRELIKAAGGRWDADKKVWHLTYGRAIEIGIEKRRIKEKKVRYKKKKKKFKSTNKK